MNPRYVIDWTDEERKYLKDRLKSVQCARLKEPVLGEGALFTIADLAIAMAFYQVKYRVIKDPVQLIQAFKQHSLDSFFVPDKEHELDRCIDLLKYAGEPVAKESENTFVVCKHNPDGSAFYVDGCYVETYYE